MDISSYYEINAQFFLYVNPENIIYTNNDKDYSNYPPEPEFKYFYLIVKNSNPGYGISQHPCKNDNRDPCCDGKNNRQI